MRSQTDYFYSSSPGSAGKRSLHEDMNGDVPRHHHGLVHRLGRAVERTIAQALRKEAFRGDWFLHTAHVVGVLRRVKEVVRWRKQRGRKRYIQLSPNGEEICWGRSRNKVTRHKAIRIVDIIDITKGTNSSMDFDRKKTPADRVLSVIARAGKRLDLQCTSAPR